MHKYGVIIYWSDEDEAYIAVVPELPGCMTHGDTQSAALANANEAIHLWIQAAKEFGNPVPKPKGRLLSYAPAEPHLAEPERAQRTEFALPIRRKNKQKVYYNLRTVQPIMNPRAR
jgi:predicted RNase H-like HicB family nuclease